MGSDTSTGMLTAVPPSANDLLGHPCAASALMSATTDRRALPRQCLGVGLADAAAGPGHDGDLVVKTAPCLSFLWPTGQLLHV